LANGVTSIGTIGIWNGSSFNPRFNPPKPFSFLVGSTEVIHGDPEIYSSQKYNNWNEDYTDIKNHHVFTITETSDKLISNFDYTYSGSTIKNDLESLGVSGGIVEFKDPWLIDYADPSYGNNIRNQGMSAPFKTRSSPFYPNYSTSYGNDVYQGVFLYQDYIDPDKPYYSVKTISPQNISLAQTGKTHKFYFQNWSAVDATLQDANALETPVVFTSSNAAVKANLKGTQLSNESDAFSSNNQRKFVKDGDGTMHHVYSSMGSVWYETSTDEGDSWNIINGSPVATGSSPSISVRKSGSNLYSFIGYQSGISTSYKVYENNIEKDSGLLELNSSNPVVNWFNNYWVIALYQSSTASAILYQVGEYNPVTQTIDWKTKPIKMHNGAKVLNTVGSSSNAAIVNLPSSSMVHLAFQNGTTSIKYQQLTWNAGTSSMSFTGYAEPSSGAAGYSNFKPSISMYGEYPVMVWVRQNIYTYVKECALRIRFSSSSWSQFYSYGYGGGDDVDIANISEGGGYDFILAWNGYGNNDKYLKSNSTTTTYTLATSGDVQVSNGSGFSGMRIQSFDKYNSPYDFTISGTDGLLKTNGANETLVARQFDLFNEVLNAQAGISEIIVDGNRIPFVGEDSFLEDSSLDFASKLETEPFTLTNNSEFTFSFNCNASVLTPAVVSPANNVNIKVKLIDAQTNAVIGVLHERIIDGRQQLLGGVNNFLVNTSGIGEREVKLKIDVKNKLRANSNYTITTRVISEGGELKKDNYEEITYTGESPVKEYSLAQNYPNPFNPSTTIKYEIPNAGNVSLKIYDVLGAEVMTLVNTSQAQGRYEVKFDASQLSSGVYIYRIQSNDYVASRKMILLK
jgi:hypothetical protein